MRWSCVVAWLGALAPSYAADSLFDEARLSQVSARMQTFVDEGQISGAVTLVATQERILHIGVVGQSDLAAGRAMTEDTLFRIASLTKTVTATALMLLVEDGRINIDDPVAKYLPAFQQQTLKDGRAARPVTIRDILTHTAGFRIIEVVSGQEFSAFCRARIFQPLGMQDTGFVLSAEQAGRLAVTYKPGEKPGELIAVEIPDPTVARTPGPSGGLYATAGDLAKFYQTILRDRTSSTPALLPAARVTQMTSPLTPGIVTGFTPGNAWGLGWCVVEHPQGVTRHLSPGTFGHGGAWGTQAWIDPQRGLILLLMFQRTGFGNSDGSNVRDAFNEAVLTAYRGHTSETAGFESFGRY
ncbi:MAG: hypothetical protein B7Z55_19705, partial [Planctomycetales bacterium 12-60-4]